MEQGFFHDGTWSSFRGRSHGVPIDVERMPAWRLVVCSQNHDQVGNRARGDRLTEALDDDQLVVRRDADALLALHADALPGRGVGGLVAVPVLHLAPRAGARARGRRGPDRGVRRGWAGIPPIVPDPQDPATYDRSNLDWSELADGRHAVVLDAYRRLASAAHGRGPSSPTPTCARSPAPPTRSAGCSRCGAAGSSSRSTSATSRSRSTWDRARTRCSSRRRPPRSWTAPRCACRPTPARWSQLTTRWPARSSSAASPGFVGQPGAGPASAWCGPRSGLEAHGRIGRAGTTG